MKLIFPIFFVNQIIHYNLHLGGAHHKLGSKFNFSDVARINFRKYIFLDIKQNLLETRRILFMIEHIASRQGRVLVSAGFIYVNPNLLNRIFYRNNMLIVSYIGNFPGTISNSILNTQGLPSAAFSSNSDKCKFLAEECHTYGIPIISLIDFGMSIKYKKTNFIDYQLIGNDDTESGAMFFILLINFCFKQGVFKVRLNLFDCNKKKSKRRCYVYRKKKKINKKLYKLFCQFRKRIKRKGNNLIFSYRYFNTSLIRVYLKIYKALKRQKRK